MSIGFQHIPNAIRVPLFYAEMDNSLATASPYRSRALLIGPTLNSKSTTPFPAISEKAVIEKVGDGSPLVDMYRAFRRNESLMEVWCLPVPSAADATAAKGSLSISHQGGATGQLHLYIGGKHIPVHINGTDSFETILRNIATAVNNLGDQQAYANHEEPPKYIEFPCYWNGETGNDIDLRLNMRGETAGEVTPTGIEVSFTPMAGGTGVPNLKVALAKLGDEEFDFIACAYSDTTSLETLKEFMNDHTGRWSYSRQLYGHVFCAIKATTATAVSRAEAINSQHLSLLAHKDSPTPPWEIAAIVTAQAAKSLSLDPARPLQTLPLIGMQPPKPEDRFTLEERNGLLFGGISTFTVGPDGVCRIERIVTSHRRNAHGQEDASYLDVGTLYTSAAVLRAMRQRISQKFGRHKLADNTARFGEGQPIVTPIIIRAELIALYAELEAQGLVENSTIFEKNLIVERSKQDPNRIDVLFPPDYVNQLRIFAVLNQFRLNS